MVMGSTRRPCWWSGSIRGRCELGVPRSSLGAYAGWAGSLPPEARGRFRDRHVRLPAGRPEGILERDGAPGARVGGFAGLRVAVRRRGRGEFAITFAVRWPAAKAYS